MKVLSQETPPVKVEIRHLERLRFEGVNSDGKKIVMDGKPPFGDGSAPSPMELLLMALGGCTAMDVVTILTKKRVKFEDFRVEVEGKRRETHPKIYTHIKVRYYFKGDIPQKAVEQAIRLSMEKYCSVSAMLKAVAKVEWEYTIER
ncbi:MAG TPA: OsmC family peroxiredoxin [Aquifex sp.]|nr:OsmC family peroxiredoxin [Aquifex sp.]